MWHEHSIANHLLRNVQRKPTNVSLFPTQDKENNQNINPIYRSILKLRII